MIRGGRADTHHRNLKPKWAGNQCTVLEFLVVDDVCGLAGYLRPLIISSFVPITFFSGWMGSVAAGYG